MALTLQVMYPVGDDTTFDYDYYTTTHMGIVGEHMGPHIGSAQIVKGLAGGPDAPAGYHAVATIVFDSKEKLDAGMAAAGPAIADIPNFTNSQPQMLVGEVIA